MLFKVDISHKQLSSIQELNAKIKKRITEINNKKIK